jgi:hypothetical protein
VFNAKLFPQPELTSQRAQFVKPWEPGMMSLAGITSGVSIKSFPDYKHLFQENYVEYKHIFLPLLKLVSKILCHMFIDMLQLHMFVFHIVFL